MPATDLLVGGAMGLLQTNEAVLAKLVRDSPVAIVVSTLADGRILDVNDSDGPGFPLADVIV